jgi:hypothetical protein
MKGEGRGKWKRYDFMMRTLLKVEEFFLPLNLKLSFRST